MRTCSGGTYREENEIWTQEIEYRTMANKKYDYSEDVQQPAESASEMAKTLETTEVTAEEATAEEARRQRLEQRNDALANEFRRLKPEIAEAYRLLNKLIEGIGAYSGIMINLHDLLKASFPIRFAENDRQALQEEIHAVADNAISRIRREREKADKDIRRNENRISMTQATFWIIIILLLGLSAFLISAFALNKMIIHSALLARLVLYIIGLLVIGITLVIIVCRKLNYSQ